MFIFFVDWRLIQHRLFKFDFLFIVLFCMTLVIMLYSNCYASQLSPLLFTLRKWFGTFLNTCPRETLSVLTFDTYRLLSANNLIPNSYLLRGVILWRTMASYHLVQCGTLSVPTLILPIILPYPCWYSSDSDQYCALLFSFGSNIPLIISFSIDIVDIEPA